MNELLTTIAAAPKAQQEAQTKIRQMEEKKQLEIETERLAVELKQREEEDEKWKKEEEEEKKKEEQWQHKETIKTSLGKFISIKASLQCALEDIIAFEKNFQEIAATVGKKLKPE